MAAWQSGTLFIGCNHTLAATLLPSLLASFHQQHPAVHLHVKVDHSDNVFALVERGIVEVGFIYDPAVRSEVVVIKELFRQPLQLLVPLDHPFTQMEVRERTLERIVAEPLLLQREGARLRKVLEHLFLRRGLSVRPIREVESIEGLKELVKRGLLRLHLSLTGCIERLGCGGDTCVRLASRASACNGLTRANTHMVTLSIKLNIDIQPGYAFCWKGKWLSACS